MWELTQFKDHEVELITALIESEIEFVIIGGAAVSLHGYKRPRDDLDLLIADRPINIDRLSDVQLNWVKFKPKNVAKLKEPGAIFTHQACGIDIVKQIAGVPADTVFKNLVFKTATGLNLPVISLHDLVQSKRAVGDEKDVIDIHNLIERNPSLNEYR